MPDHLACENGPAMSRRALLLGAASTPGSFKDKSSDPVVRHFKDWLQAKEDWHSVADLVSNGDWNHPISLAADARSNLAEDLMCCETPTTLEGIAALTVIIWNYVGAAATDPVELAKQSEAPECQALMAIWRACTGKSGYPVV